jgi:hypothetical protein
MRKLLVVLSAVLLFAAPGHVRAEREHQTFVLTASNTVPNHLLIYDGRRQFRFELRRSNRVEG